VLQPVLALSVIDFFLSFFSSSVTLSAIFLSLPLSFDSIVTFFSSFSSSSSSFFPPFRFTCLFLSFSYFFRVARVLGYCDTSSDRFYKQGLWPYFRVHDAAGSTPNPAAAAFPAAAADGCRGKGEFTFFVAFMGSVRIHNVTLFRSSFRLRETHKPTHRLEIEGRG
jgi:phosphoglycerol transferase MdoB-like AlkP superfamily enzyme